MASSICTHGLVVNHRVAPGVSRALTRAAPVRGASRGARLVVSASSKGSKESASRPLPSSLLFPTGELPPDGRTLKAADEFCNPELKNCRTVVNTWEQPCDLCAGDGNVRTHKSGRKKKKTTLATCLKCSGLGYVRMNSSRVIPDLENAAGRQLTLCRQPESQEAREKTRKLQNFRAVPDTVPDSNLPKKD
mmetsp:Transcript_8593/g.14821  ORF Transcript_8593/g.14821 Transcript_8593/m.14821 type:complete len:191 (+) Transcript_8593:113-685(+)